MVIKYTIEYILSKKNTNIDDNILSVFNNIRSSLNLSSEHIENKRKVNYLTHKNNKKDDIVNIFQNCLNRITMKNYTTILNDILKIKILSKNELEKIVKKILVKMLNEKQFINIYSILIKDIITKSKWVIDDNTFRILLIKEIETNHNTINNIVLYSIIGELYLNKIISKTLIVKLMNDFIVSYEKTSNELFIEKYIILWSYYTKINIDIVFNLIIYNKISKRLQFMVIDINEQKKSTFINNSDKTKEEFIDETNNEINNYIEYIDEYDNIESFLDDMFKKYKMIKLLELLIRYTIDNNKEFKKITDVLVEGKNKKLWSKNDILKITKYIKKNEMNDIIIDSPYYIKHIEYYETL